MHSSSKEGEDTALLGLKEVDDGLVVNVLDLPPPEALELVDLLLLLEDLLVEVLLDLLVGKVDAELLKAVLLKDLEPGNVEDTNNLFESPQGMAMLILATMEPKRDW